MQTNKKAQKTKSKEPCSGGEPNSNPDLSRPGTYVEPIGTSGGQGLSNLPVRGEGGFILSAEPRMHSRDVWTCPKRNSLLAPTPGLKLSRSSGGVSTYSHLRALLLILLPSKEESLWDWLTKLCPTLCSLLLGPLVYA